MPTFATSSPLQPSKSESRTKLPIPPPWYSLQTTTTTNQPYIALPQTTISTTESTQRPRPAIFLTAFHPTDGPALQAILSLPEINSSLIRVPTPYTLADAEGWIHLQRNPNPAAPKSSSSSSPSSSASTSIIPGSTTPSPAPWLQALRAFHPDGTGTFIGAASLTPIAAGSAFSVGDHDARHTYELGYYLHPTFQGLGIMRNAVAAVVAWGVAEKGVRVVRAEIAEENLRSRGVVEGLEGWERVLVGEGCDGDGDGGGEGALEVEVAWPGEKGGGNRRMEMWCWRSGLLDGGAGGMEGRESGASCRVRGLTEEGEIGIKR